jgi:protein O-GlcNAc transferase
MSRHRERASAEPPVAGTRGIEDLFRAGVAHHQAGRLVEAEAEACYRQMLAAHPGHPDALHLLGTVAQQVGRHGLAVDLIRQAIQNNPGNAAYFSNLGCALRDLGQLDDAVAACREAIRIKPYLAQAHLNLSNALKSQGKLDEAIVACRHAIGVIPDLAEAHFTLGIALAEQDDLDKAVAAYREAIRIKPGFAEAHFNLGNVVSDAGRLDEAVAAYRAAIGIKPGMVEAHSGLGNVLRRQGKLDEAIAACRRAIGIDPNHAEAHFNLGNALSDQRALDAAVAAFRQAIGIRPGKAEAHCNLGTALFGQGRLDEAVAAYRQAIRINPDLAEGHFNLGNALRDLGLNEAEVAFRQALHLRPDYAEARSNLGNTLRDLGKLGEAIAAFREAIRIKPDMAVAHCSLGATLCDQGKLDDAIAVYRHVIALNPDFADADASLLFCLNYGEHISPAALSAAHRAWDERHARPLSRSSAHANDRSVARRLRVGYVSPDFRQHSVAHFLEPLLISHDRNEIELFCYAEVSSPDATTVRFKRLADHWVSTVGMLDEAVAERIGRDRIDILVDLAGHTSKNRLLVFARKPAPVQVTWLGYPNTTGLTALDYRLVDAVTDPEGQADAFASETLVRLAGGFLCYGGSADAPAPEPPPCLATGTVTFGSFNNPAKLSEATLDAWAMVLMRLPQSRLLLKGKPFVDDASRASYLERLGRRGVSATRVEVATFVPDAEHLAAYGRVDIALDPFPYNGTTTTCEALWMGVPVVALRGDRHAGRVGASLLTQIGLNDLVADSVEEYVEIAAALAGDPARLADLRRSLRPRMAASELCDAPGFARKIEAAYRAMWQRWCAASNPAQP